MKRKSFYLLIITGVIALVICGFGFTRLTSQVKTTNSQQESAPVTETTLSSEKKMKLKKYAVQKSDTLASIAEICDMSINELAEINDMKVTKVLKTGQVIKVPANKYKKLMKAHDEDESTSTEDSTVESTTSTEVETSSSSQTAVATENVTPASSSQSTASAQSAEPAAASSSAQEAASPAQDSSAGSAPAADISATQGVQ